MAIPDYQKIWLALLKFLSDQKEHNVREMIDYLADKFQLSDEDRKRLLPSGNDVQFDNKVKWARLYLGKAGLLESIKKGYWKITKRGLELLSQNPSGIDPKLLGQFPEYREWKKTTTREVKEEISGRVETIEEQTPEEALEYWQAA